MIRGFPSSDDVAVAIVAACRETGEDPIICASRETGNIRARHYAMHALCHVFAGLTPAEAARAVGCVGNPGTVFAVSKVKCFRAAGWWNERAYCRIVFAIQEGKVPPPEPPPYFPPEPPARDIGTLEAEGYRPPPETIKKVIEDDADRRPSLAPGKRALYKMLGDAVRNTAKLQKPEQ